MQSKIEGALTPKQAETILRDSGTNAEIEFITGLGGFSKCDCTRTDLLKKYIRSAENRHNWGNIDKTAALRYAKKCLGDE